MLPGDLAEIIEFLLGCGKRSSAQFLEESFNSRNIISHFPGKTEVCPVGITQSLSLLAFQAEDFLNQGPVVEISAAGSSDMGSVGGFPQGAAVGMGDEGDVARHVQPNQPGTVRCCCARVSRIAGSSGQSLQSPLGKTGHLLLLRELQGPLLCGIEHVVAKTGGEGCQAFTGFVEGGFLLACQGDTALLHRQQFGLENPNAGRGEWFRRSIPETGESRMHCLALTESVAQTHNLRLLLRVGSSQLR